jgi:hypothetical protein
MFWRGTTIDVDTRLRVGRAIGKNVEEVARAMMLQIRDCCNSIGPPAISSDGNDSYPEAMLETWENLPEYAGRGRPPKRKQSHPGRRCLQVTKHRCGSRLIQVTHKVIYGDPNDVPDFVGLNTSYFERTNLTSRQLDGRIVRKVLSFSKEEKVLEASCALEDSVYNLTRSVKSLRFETNCDHQRWEPRSTARAAGLTDHIRTIGKIMMRLVVPECNNAK